MKKQVMVVTFAGKRLGYHISASLFLTLPMNMVSALLVFSAGREPFEERASMNALRRSSSEMTSLFLL